MLLAIDLPLGAGAAPEEYLRQLRLPPDTEVLENVGAAGDLGSVDRVIYITTLDNGGLKYQRDFLRNNGGVAEWLVLSEGTKDYLIDQFRTATAECAGLVRLFTDMESLAEALRRPSVRRNSCLLCTRDGKTETGGFRKLLEETLKGWAFTEAALSDTPDALETNTCSRVLLLGRESRDFDLPVPVPDHVRPVLVLLREESGEPGDLYRLCRDCFSHLRGPDWGEALRAQNFFLVYPLYERWGWECREGLLNISVLEKDERFVMWDVFGLPEPVQAYTAENAERFLRRFDGCERLAERLRQAN